MSSRYRQTVSGAKKQRPGGQGRAGTFVSLPVHKLQDEGVEVKSGRGSVAAYRQINLDTDVYSVYFAP